MDWFFLTLWAADWPMTFGASAHTDYKKKFFSGMQTGHLAGNMEVKRVSRKDTWIRIRRLVYGTQGRRELCTGEGQL